MAQDIRKMLKGHTDKSPKLSKDHEASFEARLAEAFPQEKPNTAFFWMKIAAVGILLLSIGFFGYQQLSNQDGVDTIIADATENTVKNTNKFTLGDISPGLKKVEDFYMNGINVQLASLQVDDENKDLIDKYLERLTELDAEYTMLNNEMNVNGPSEETVTALIDNLKFRLELLFKLKNKLKELKNINNEEFSSIQS
ncbi:MAG: hypothetical protein ACI83B_001293 [Sediminicola sp.]|jgi:hypothetical protein|tara:strand:- start:426 stop:1016 length:591 start_codon:yes stop_codon:yes gene_type:complete